MGTSILLKLRSRLWAGIFVSALFFNAAFVLPAKTEDAHISFGSYHNPPYFTSHNGGLWFDILSCALQNSGFTFEFKSMPIRRVMLNVSSGYLDAYIHGLNIKSFEKTETYHKIHMTDMALIYVFQKKLLAGKDTPFSADLLKGRRLGVARNAPLTPYFKKWVQPFLNMKTPP